MGPRLMAGRQWIVSQIGSREHYAIARSFSQTGQLHRLYTDAWARGTISLLRYGNAPMRSLAARRHPGISEAKVTSFNSQAILTALRGALRPAKSVESEYENHLLVGEKFDRAVVRHLSRDKLPDACAVFAYNTAALATIQFCKSLGMPAVVDQIDPARIEEDIVVAESEKWPEWEKLRGRVPQSYWDRLSAEWEAADKVVVNSDWCKAALVKQGVSAEKLVVVPLVYEAASHAAGVKERKPALRVLWLGTVNLRKGIPYLIQAARELKGAKVEFLIAGPIAISDQAMTTAPESMRFMGRVTRDRAAALFAQADVFVLPTISDGFAVTQLEAMSHGMPVITTPNCGNVVEHGVSGFIVPPGDASNLAQAMLSLQSDRERLEAMSQAALRRSGDFRLPMPAVALEAAIATLRG